MLVVFSSLFLFLPTVSYSIPQSSNVISSYGSIMYEARHRYVVFYGWLHDGNGLPNERCKRIATASPEILFTYMFFRGSGRWNTNPDGELNLTPEVISLLKGNGVKIYAYVPTEWGKYDISAVLKLVDKAKELNLEGVKIDECFAFAEGLEKDPAPARLEYYRKIYSHAKSLGLQVMANTGTKYTNEIWMELTDIIGFEHEWRDFPTLKAPYNCGGGWWMSKYSPDRFMGASSRGWIDSNTGNWADPMGYPITLETAIRDTKDAWNLGIGWHYSCISWWDFRLENSNQLPDWFENYEAAISNY